jgi:hypothetical protein
MTATLKARESQTDLVLLSVDGKQPGLQVVLQLAVRFVPGSDLLCT